MVFIHSRDYDCQSQHGHVDGLGRFVGTTRKVALHTLDSTYSNMYFSTFGDLTAGLHQNTNCIFDVHYLVTCRHGSDHVSVNSTLASQSPRDLEARVMPEHAI